MTHPQRDELIQALQDLWRLPEGQLFACEPDSYQCVGFIRSDGETIITAPSGRGPADPDAGMLERLGFTFHKRFAMNPRTLERIEVYSARRLAATPEEAVDIALGVIERFLEIPADTWLYLTPTSNPDDWPLDLPRPGR